MNYARIDGTIVASACHRSMGGTRTVICQPIDAEGRDEGAPILAVDPLGAGLHEVVILSTDGSATREFVRDPKSPLRNLIIGIVDPTAT
ncbi:EutN/CcmL family microcompartment protein [Opitutus terrae]|uniref:Ethanolamine utilization protein EutN/carboxysome structural protein Ccml n=1 Tax=Opitutus terrae (strain DSM 11246 / JCM 15787 / PB90-1) TaxID=452637 RepID=B1ZR94_OPITP|nr:EutN/CcmL family microcompartment protein [Opitutus terrae]ACB74581.1 Ethanolamine utilization protein EutN/carboxysome structural protein Ccml [Opitutus terrae PB90-1]